MILITPNIVGGNLSMSFEALNYLRGHLKALYLLLTLPDSESDIVPCVEMGAVLPLPKLSLHPSVCLTLVHPSATLSSLHLSIRPHVYSLYDYESGAPRSCRKDGHEYNDAAARCDCCPVPKRGSVVKREEFLRLELDAIGDNGVQ